MPSCGVCLSVRLSCCLSRSFIVSERVNISSKLFHRRDVAHHSSFSVPNVMAILRWNPLPLTGASNVGGGGKNQFSINFSLHRVLSTARPSRVVNRMPPDRDKLVTVITGSSKWRRLLIAWDRQRNAMHHWMLFMTERLNFTPKTTEQKQEAQLSQRPHDASCHWIFC